MINKLAHKIVTNMLKENIINGKQTQFYEYAFIIKAESAITILSILTLSLIYKLIGPTIIFLVFFLELRKRTGGFHAKTFFRCFIMSNIIIYVFFALIYPILIIQEMKLIFVSSTVAFIVIYSICTVNHPNWNLSNKEYKQMKIMSRYLICLEYFAVSISIALGIDKSYIIMMSFAIILCAASIVVSIINIKRRTRIMKKKCTTIVLKLTEKILREKVKKEYDGWPPYCNGIFYQPKRPVKK